MSIYTLALQSTHWTRRKPRRRVKKSNACSESLIRSIVWLKCHSCNFDLVCSGRWSLPRPVANKNWHACMKRVSMPNAACHYAMTLKPELGRSITRQWQANIRIASTRCDLVPEVKNVTAGTFNCINIYVRAEGLPDTASMEAAMSLPPAGTANSNAYAAGRECNSRCAQFGRYLNFVTYFSKMLLIEILSFVAVKFRIMIIISGSNFAKGGWHGNAGKGRRCDRRPTPFTILDWLLLKCGLKYF